MSQAVKKLISRQEALKKSITAAASDFASRDDSAQAESEARADLEQLESWWLKFEANHENIVDYNAEGKFDANPYFVNDLYQETCRAHRSFKGALLHRLKASTNISTVATTPGPPHDSTLHQGSLPTLQLPKFSGRYEEWRSFYDRFQSIVGQNARLAPVVKLQYLIGCLSGDALTLVATIALQDNNYEYALERLRSRFENKRVIVNAHFDVLFALKPASRKCAKSLEQVRSTVSNVCDALELLGGHPAEWDFFLVYFVTKKLDADSQEAWELSLGTSTDPPPYKSLDEFLVSRVRALESLGTKPISAPARPQSAWQPNQSQGRGARVHAGTRSAPTQPLFPCCLCSGQHLLHQCEKYQEMSPQQRHAFLQEQNRCLNCFAPSHSVKNCRSFKRCFTCNKLHHTSIHEHCVESALNPTAATFQPVRALTARSGATPPHQSTNQITNSQVLLATAEVKAVSLQGAEIPARALIDQGSELSFVCESLAQALRLRRRGSSIPLVGIGANQSISTRGVVRLTLRPHFSSTEHFQVDAHVLTRITKLIPSAPVQQHHWRHLVDLNLADPRYSMPGHIDILLGADIYGHLLQSDVIRGRDGEPVAQRTSLGWIISGPASARSESKQITPFIGQCAVNEQFLAYQQLHDAVHKFWNQESVPQPDGGHRTEADQHCEMHFRNTHSRDRTGRYTVRLPFKTTANLGASKPAAMKMLENLQRKFRLKPDFCQLYSAFLAEYESLGHMQQVDSHDPDIGKVYYLPHHGVLKESSSTTKLRVVFNGSQKTSEDISLNDVLYAGPKVQQDLDAVLLRWRVFPYVFSSDIEKMYRQIRVHPEDQKYQRILWSEDPSKAPITYQLTTVTYGLTSAPFLAIRTLLQLAEDEGKRFPLGAETVRKMTYVDDCLSGGYTIELARERAVQTDKLLMAGGFTPQKWASNEPAVLSQIETARKLQAHKTLGDDACLRALGLKWDPTCDAFVFSFCSESSTSDTGIRGTITKRSVLSVIARLFDPLGWLAPAIILAKIFLQSLWTTQLGWDDPLPTSLSNRWKVIVKELHAGVSFSIPRWLGTLQSSVIEIHGFSDASRIALSAVVYIRVVKEDLTASVTLLTAKTKVAPLKPVTIPRLELSAATLLAQLVVKVQQILDLTGVLVHLWVDSSVALTWIRNHPSRWKEFVSNRVALIQELLPGCHWNHVAGSENPADLATRGLFPSDLKAAKAWWNGPEWLTSPSTTWPSAAPDLQERQEEINLEERAPLVLTTASSPTPWKLIDEYSSLNHLLRITAIILFAVSRLRRHTSPESNVVPVTPAQLHGALIFWIRQTQTAYFKTEISLLRRGESLPKANSLLRLVPYLDEEGLLRVGGRLQNALVDEEQKHPYILPRTSSLTTLLIRRAHFRTLHGGTQLTLATLRQQVWIIGGRASVRSAILRCVTCARQRGATLNQRMGQLPLSRTTPTRPFLNAGVDYAGPFSLKLRRDRSFVTYKGYLVLFVCLSTSAVHLELATNYSTEGFLAAYKRFTGRRGVCASLTSDCGTNFVGADKELKRLFSESSKEFAHLRRSLANNRTAWHFNPPGAPHFGGKWEAAVKSTKFHLRRVIGSALLTYEEFNTLLVEIECVLNSRPLCALSDDPTDLSVLTPGHFLIGEALNTLPEPSLNHLPASRLSQWQRIRQMLDHFWQRWSREYLQSQQSVSKWQNPQRQLPVGAIVLIVDERFPPSKWPLARVVDVHPGKDGLVRVATLKVAGGTTLRRPITKLCLLPVAESTALPDNSPSAPDTHSALDTPSAIDAPSAPDISNAVDPPSAPDTPML